VSARPRASSAKRFSITCASCRISTQSHAVGLDLQYGVAQALVRKAAQAQAPQNAERVFANILRYARAFPQRELGVMLVTDMHRRIGRPLYDLPEFREWAQSVTDLLLYDRG
jgi:hypothetical protein